MAEKKPIYIRCPRCELNYCLKKDKYCSVCKAEMEGDKEALIDDLELELCPICKTNYIQPDEIMCATCLKERENNGEVTSNDEEWQAYMERDDNDFVSEDEETGDMASISEIDDDVLGADIDEDLSFALDLDGDDKIDEEEDDDDENNDDDDDFEKIDDEDIDDDDLDDDDDDDDEDDDDDDDDDDDYIKPKKAKKRK